MYVGVRTYKICARSAIGDKLSPFLQIKRGIISVLFFSRFFFMRCGQNNRSEPVRTCAEPKTQNAQPWEDQTFVFAALRRTCPILSNHLIENPFRCHTPTRLFPINDDSWASLPPPPPRFRQRQRKQMLWYDARRYSQMMWLNRKVVQFFMELNDCGGSNSPLDD